MLHDLRARQSASPAEGGSAFPDKVGHRFLYALDELLKAHIADLEQLEAETSIGDVLDSFAVSVPRPGITESATRCHPFPQPSDEGDASHLPIRRIYHTPVMEEHPVPSCHKQLSDTTRDRAPSNTFAGQGRSQSSPLGHTCLQRGQSRSSNFSLSKATLSERSAASAASNISSRSTSRRKTQLSDFAVDFFRGTERGSKQSDNTSSTSSNASSPSRVLKSKSSTKVHLLIDSPDQQSGVARLFHMIMPLLILLSVFVAFLQVDEALGIDNTLLASMNLGFNVMFFIEVVIRAIVHPTPLALISCRIFLIDCMSVIPVNLFFAGHGDDKDFTLEEFGAARRYCLCTVPAMRLFKILRYMQNLHLLTHSFKLVSEAMPVMLLVMLIILWFFASLFLIFEPSDNIASASQAVWLSVITMSTVGYGDVYPTTKEGRIAGGILAILSLLYMAMPLGIIGNIFTNVWDDRDRLHLMYKTRERLSQWGYKADDIPSLFDQFDTNGTGELDVFSFQDLVIQMSIGFDEKRTQKLFREFDQDGNGTIDAAEFIRYLFPTEFHRIYGSSVESKSESSFFSWSTDISELPTLIRSRTLDQRREDAI